jgi:hypothetical protein
MRTSPIRVVAGLLLVSFAVASTGCVRTSSMAYPQDWAPSAAIEKAQCPQIAGRYVNAGEIANGTSPGLFRTGSRHEYRAEWRSDSVLSHNIAAGGSGEWVELRQPDRDTLIVVLSDPTAEVRELHRSRDFTCSVRGLDRRLHAGLTSVGNNSDHESALLAGFNGVEMAYSAALGTGGMRTLTRSFKPASDGSLVMTVTQSETGLMLLIPFHERQETYVRWIRSDSPLSDAQTPESDTTAILPYGDIPSTHVGLFVSQIDHQLSPMRDFNTVVGFEMSAAPGHRYRLDKRPQACPTPGDIDVALASPHVYRTRITILDEAPGIVTRRFEVDAQCVSGWGSRTPPPDASASSLHGVVSNTLEH